MSLGRRVVLVDLLSGRYSGGHVEDYMLALERALADLDPLVWAPFLHLEGADETLRAPGWRGRWRRVREELRRFAEARRRNALLVFHTPELRQIALLWLLSASGLMGPHPASILFLRRDASILTGGRRLLDRLATWMIVALVRRRAAFPISDSAAAARYWEDRTGHSVPLVPIPPRDVPAAAPRRSGPERAGLVGLFRREKGSASYGAVIRAIRQIAPEAVVSTQVPEPDAADSDDARIAAALVTEYEGDARVSFLRGHLPGGAFDDLLASLDVVVLPYDVSIYGSGTSGVMADALAAGVVVAATPIQWAAEEFAAHPNVVWLRDLSDDALVEGVRAAFERARALRAGAEVPLPDRDAFAREWHRVIEAAVGGTHG